MTALTFADAAKAYARESIVAAGDTLVALSRRIHAHPELGFEEVRACDWLARTLDGGGFAVERGIGDLPTAFAARAGSGTLHVLLCAEYDALPEIGHACGHNLIAAMSVGAGFGLRGLVDELDVELTVLGTPAEELGNGKALLLERGAFRGAHAAFMAHPAPVDVLDPPLLAIEQLDVGFEGERSRDFPDATGAGNAAVALTLSQVAIGMLRGRLRPTDRVHGIVSDGGCATPGGGERVSATYMVRANTLKQLRALSGRVRRCFEAGALGTGARLTVTQPHAPYAEMRHHPELSALYARNALALGRHFPDLGNLLERGLGSTDMGNVSQLLPAIHPAIGIDSLPAANHQPEFTAHCVTPAAERALLDGATALAWTIIDVAREARLRARLLARAEASA
jgi:amidohydrolase